MKPFFRLISIGAIYFLLISINWGVQEIWPGVVTAHGAQNSIEVLGSWIVKGKSAMEYVITFYPDNTFSMTYSGKKYKGTYTIAGTTVTLVPAEGTKLVFKFVKGPEMMKDRLVEATGFSWERV
jgi:hypothetical protein